MKLSQFSQLPKLVRYGFFVASINITIFFLFRLVFWGYFQNPADPIPSESLWQSFFVGFKYDVRLALFIVLPMLILSLIPGVHAFRSKIGQYVWHSYLVFVFALTCLFYVFNFGFFAYLKVPLDATVLRFLENANTSMQMVWQSYPVIWIVIGLGVFVAIYNLLLKRLFAAIHITEERGWPKRQKVLLNLILGLMILFSVYGKFSYYPLRWSDAFFSTHHFASSVTINPVLYSLTTLKNKDIQYDKQKTQDGYPAMVQYLGIDEAIIEPLNFARLGKPNRFNVKQANVVIVILESFASYKSSVSGNPLNPTPHFQKLAENGIYFNNFFTPHTGTARSVFTTITGLPDVDKVKTSTRNPLIVKQHSIVNAFEGYEKLYFIGGSASWGNIRGLLSHNIPDLKLYEEGGYESPRIDVWGISDLDLFKESVKVLAEKRDKPFFAIIQTSGNHRPYTIPDSSEGFKLSGADNSEVVKHGFESAEEYDSFRFMDHSIGYFMQRVQMEPFYDNTIFVFYGDHGIHASTGKHVPTSEAQLGLQGLRVPLVIYAPKLLPVGLKNDVIASEVDVLPTIAGLAANQYTNSTLGRDLFDQRFADQRYAITIQHGSHLKVGLLGKEYYFVMDEDGKQLSLHQLKREDARQNVLSEYPRQADKMHNITQAIFESVRYMRYHNGQIEHLANK